MKFKWPNKYACKIGHKLIQFTFNGTYETEDEEIIKVLSWLSPISVIGETKKETKKEKKVEGIEEVEENKKETSSIEELRAIYFEKFDKKVPVNKKNDAKWITSKISD